MYVFSSMFDAGKAFGVTNSAIQMAIKGDRKCKGIVYEYI